MSQVLSRFRSIRPFWNPAAECYFQYGRPQDIAAVRTRCGVRLEFKADPTKTHEFDEKASGCLVLRSDVEGTVTGRGSCGKIVSSLDWPNDAFLKVRLAEGLVGRGAHDIVRCYARMLLATRPDCGIRQ